MNLMQRRRELMKIGESDIIFVDYITKANRAASSAVDTLILPTDDSRLEFEIHDLDITRTYYTPLLGFQRLGGACIMLSAINSTSIAPFCLSYSESATITLDDTLKASPMEWAIWDKHYILNGTEYVGSQTYPSLSANRNFTIFLGTNRVMNFKIGYLRISKGGVLVADMRPAIQGGVYGFWDMVRKIFITTSETPLIGGNY